jgi:hypothetical protein
VSVLTACRNTNSEVLALPRNRTGNYVEAFLANE